MDLSGIKPSTWGVIGGGALLTGAAGALAGDSLAYDQNVAGNPYMPGREFISLLGLGVAAVFGAATFASAAKATDHAAAPALLATGIFGLAGIAAGIPLGINDYHSAVEKVRQE